MKIDRFTVITCCFLLLSAVLFLCRPTDKPTEVQLVHFDDNGNITAIDDFQKTVEPQMDPHTKLWYDHYKK